MGLSGYLITRRLETGGVDEGGRVAGGVVGAGGGDPEPVEGVGDGAGDGLGDGLGVGVGLGEGEGDGVGEG